MNGTNVILNFSQCHDIGLFKFWQSHWKSNIECIEIEIINLGSKYFQNSESPFCTIKNYTINSSWFKWKLGRGSGEEVTQSWLIYSSVKQSAFCLCCLLFFRSDRQSTLERESGFNHWKAPERMNLHQNSRNHRKCFAQ